MDRLASCYFCGDAFDASLSEYPAVPKELQPPEDGPTVVLCGDCRGKLGAVIEEVVAATGDDATVDAAAPDERNEPTATAGASGAEPADSSGGSLFDGDGETTTDADEWESPASDGSDDEAPTTTSEDRATADEDTTATTASSGPADDSAADDDGPTLTKLEYNRVMRLLQNRPFPVDRSEIREVATSAYEIDSAEFDAVIEAAVERDLIAVENGQFVDPA